MEKSCNGSLTRSDKKNEEKIQKAVLPEERVQKKEDDKLQKAQAPEEKLQRKASDGAPAVSSDVQSAIRSKTTGGQPLSADVRGHMEPRFNADFSTVRVHADPESASAGRTVPPVYFWTPPEIEGSSSAGPNGPTISVPFMPASW